MKTSALSNSSGTHDFIAHVTEITFDFAGYDWEEQFDSEAEWIEYQRELGTKYASFSVYFEDYDLPESDDEDETLEEHYASNHLSDEGHYYRALERWIDEETGWLFLSLEYSIEKV